MNPSMLEALCNTS